MSIISRQCFPSGFPLASLFTVQGGPLYSGGFSAAVDALAKRTGTPDSSGVIITGVAGFIGSALARAYLLKGIPVLGLDAVREDDAAHALKQDRLARLRPLPGFSFAHTDLTQESSTRETFQRAPGARVLHLAAQPGVRHPQRRDFISANLIATFNVLEAAVEINAPHLIFASSSTVYGSSATPPFAPDSRADRPRSLYAATKISGEAMACSYALESGLPCTVIRLFNVYGPWGRPDTALHQFTRAILDAQPIDLFDHGRTSRDFTYIDDVVRCILALEQLPPREQELPYRVCNIGSGRPVQMARVVEMLEHRLSRETQKRMLPLVLSDMQATAADVEQLERTIGFRPTTPLEEGLSRYVSWFLDYYRR